MTQPVTTSSFTTYPDPEIIIRTDPPISQGIIVTAGDLKTAGTVLGIVVVLSAVMNLYTFYVVTRNWRRFIQYPFSQSNVMCMFLSLADLVFALFVGLPAALHLQYAVYFSDQHSQTMVKYARSVEWFLFEYVFLLRVVIIAVICIDRCIHIIRPLTYKFFVTHRVTITTCLIVLAIPFLMRTLPNIVYLNLGGDISSDIVCSAFYKVDITTITDTSEKHDIMLDYSDHAVEYTVPLTCKMTLISDGQNQTAGHSTINQIALSEVLIMITGLLISWLSIIISNIIIMAVIIKRTKDRGLLMHDPNVQKKKVQQSIQKNLIATMIMSLAFLATNSPYIIIYLTEYIACFIPDITFFLQKDEKVRLYMVMSLFLSLLINPWLYLFRMETIRKFFPCFEGSDSSVTGSFTKRLTATRTQLEFTLRSPTRQRTTSQEHVHPHGNFARASTRLVNRSCSSLEAASPHPSPLPCGNGKKISRVSSPFNGIWNGGMERCEEDPSHGGGEQDEDRISGDKMTHEMVSEEMVSDEMVSAQRMSVERMSAVDARDEEEHKGEEEEDSEVLDSADINCIITNSSDECMITNPVFQDTLI